MKKDKILIILGIILTIGMWLFTIRIMSGEDNWICVKGEWVKHGAPSAPKPTSICR